MMEKRLQTSLQVLASNSFYLLHQTFVVIQKFGCCIVLSGLLASHIGGGNDVGT